MNEQTDMSVQPSRTERPRASVGDNSIAKDQLKSIIERIEKLEEEKKAVGEDVRGVYLESKSNGFDVKAIRTIVRMRRMDPAERREQEAVLETYMRAVGLI